MHSDSYRIRLCCLERLEDRSLLTTILVLEDQPSIQAGIDAAQDGDLLLASPRTDSEKLTLSGKTITLPSQFHTTSDPSFIDQTIIDVNAGHVIIVAASVGPDIGLKNFPTVPQR